MNFTRKQLPGFGIFRQICRSNFRTFSGNGSRSFRGSLHSSSFHGRHRGSRGYRTTSQSRGRSFNRRFRNPSSLAYAHGGSTRNFPSALPCYQVPNAHPRPDVHVFPRQQEPNTHPRPDTYVLPPQLSQRLYRMYCNLNRPSAVGRCRACSPCSYGTWAREQNLRLTLRMRRRHRI